MNGARIAARAPSSRAPCSPQRSSGDARKETGSSLRCCTPRWQSRASRLAALLVQVITDGIGRVSTDLFTNQPVEGAPRDVRHPVGDLSARVWLMVLTAVFVIPIGVATAIYLEQYADRRRWYNRVIEVNIQNLASVPSVVYGLLGLAFIVRGPLVARPDRSWRAR